MNRYLILVLFCLFLFNAVGQRGKDGDYTVAALDEVVNTYTPLAASTYPGLTQIEVVDNSLSGAGFSGNLQAGDLLLIYQVRGIHVDVNDYTTTGWGGVYTVQNSFFDPASPFYGIYNFMEFGAVTNYYSAGLFQFVEVVSVEGNDKINLKCPLDYSFFVGAHDDCVVIRVPRYDNLTVPSGTSITSPAWNGTTGGVVAVEVDGDLVLNGRIHADARGFRGGVAVNNSEAAGGAGSISNLNDRGYVGSNTSLQGSEKGESIFGSQSYYNLEKNSRYGYGSIANGGGGGGYHNAGGGGGSNVGNGAYYGYGVVDRGAGNAYDPAWNLESPNLINQPSAGGGRGGYSGVSENLDPLTVGPHNNSWGPDYRRISGGVGGHPLAYDVNRIFMGGGGGGGHGNNNFGGDGGNGGGVVFVTIYGETTGGGIISANGQNGESTEGSQPGLLNNSQTGGDGGGGAGGGGAIMLKNSNVLPASVQLQARGGKGGDVVIKVGGLYSGFEAHGPGGGGAGGMIAVANGAPTQDVSGGSSGIVTSQDLSGSIMSNFPVNGATKGANGLSSQFAEFVEIIVENDTVCAGDVATITPTVSGNFTPGNLSWFNSYHTRTPFHTGSSYTTPPLTSNVTYYIGFCDAPFRVPVTIVVATPIVISGPAVINPETCNGNDGEITGLTAFGGVGTLTFDWNGMSSPTTNLTGASAGTYTLTVTDEKGCTSTSGPYTISVTPDPIIDASIHQITGESCNGNDGAITGITVSGGEAPYSFAWNGASSPTIDLTNATGGTYTLEVTDANNCVATAGPFTIGASPGPAIDITNMVITDESCHGNDGQITGVTASGGTGTLTFSWNGINTPNTDLLNVSAGTYTLTVTDGNNCSQSTGPHTVGTVPQIVIDESNMIINDESCHGNDGSISGINVTGGSGSLSYSWSPSGGNTLDISGMSTGNYQLTVTDALGCTATSNTYFIDIAPPIVLDETSATVIDATCGTNNGSVTGITVSGGVAPYQYEWNGNTTPNIDLLNVDGGTYVLVVTDVGGCTVTSNAYSVNDIPVMNVDASNVNIKDVSCNGNDGEINGIVVSGGTMPYSFDWNGQSSTSADLTGAAQGVYTLTVTDGNGCVEIVGPFTIGVATPPLVDDSGVILTDESCQGNDGSITGIVVTGGESPYNYDWNGVPSPTIDLFNATGGTYTLTITDANNCVVTAGPYTIVATTGPTIDASNVVISNETCHGNDGSITGIVVTGGVSPVIHSWNGGLPSGVDLNNASAGVYTLTVADASGCVVTAGPFTIDADPDVVLDESYVVVTDETCQGNDGSISGINASGGVGALTYSWSPNGETTSDISGLSAGTYTLTVSDANNCTAVSSPYVVQLTPGITIDASNVVVNDASCGNSNGSITGFDVNGGTPPYTFEWNGVTNPTADLTNASPGTYTLTVTDVNGCTETIGAYTINDLPSPSVDASGIKINDESCDGNDGSITGIEVSGGTAPYTFMWNGVSVSTEDLFDASAGIYNFTVSDANGCTVNEGPYAINGPVLPSVVITSPDQEIDYGESVNINTTYSPTGTTLSWSPADGLNCTTCDEVVATPETSTWYVVTATSVDGCTSSDSIYVKVIDPCNEAQFPTVFSPNDDGLNDFYCILGGCFKYMELRIYNRWGELMFVSNDENECWDGTFRGERVNTGSYAYYFKGIQIDGKEVSFSGNINLIR